MLYYLTTLFIYSKEIYLISNNYNFVNQKVLS